ncbi:MAG: CocE/NonD family hydrolase, partial [Clostridia bacterium]|nr:CocE/NonD family hydrolase [Clostridia bacterium]
VRLYTRCVLPYENGKFPIVFIRTPYEPALNGAPCDAQKYENDQFLRAGYALVVQHTRGCGDSEGECVPYRERNDGLDTLDIIRTLPFYMGEIYLTGGSYLATVHLCYLDSVPSDVKAAALFIQQDSMFSYQHHNGCCRSFCGFSWYLEMIKKSHPKLCSHTEATYRPYYKMMERAIGEDFPEFTRTLLSDTYDEFWQGQENDHSVDTLDIPIMLVGGWFDFYTDGMLSMWERLPEKTKQKSLFVMGPWGHSTRAQGAEYPLENGDIPGDWAVRFFDSVREGRRLDRFELGKMHYYSIGNGCWGTDIDTDTGERRLYFGADGSLGDTCLHEGERTYEFDPDKPLNYYRYMNIYKAPDIGSAEGVLSFVSDIAQRDESFFGRIGWRMNIRTDCDDTAFFMRVYFVEDGKSYNLTQAITSVLHACPDYRAGEEHVIEAFTSPIAFTLKKGCRIRVDISSHSDLYVPHTNTKEHWALAESVKVATNTVICGANSYISLPVVGMSEI